MGTRIAKSDHWKIFGKALCREWKVLVIGTASILASWLLIEVGENPFGEIALSVTTIVIGLHLIVLFFNPNAEDLSPDTMRKIELFIDHHLWKVWLVVGFGSALGAFILAVLAIAKLLSEPITPTSPITSAPYICASVFFFGIFSTLKNVQYGKQMMLVGFCAFVLTVALNLY
ncbi:hypothetical protein J4N45_09920 [Vibrio sp. SCSIO 43140]|uniref:hypothetical protein n=1 Tax=Vibrio sp. SCSIO 43140 TaxID=2819100 RepID=UPI002075DE94|nr:hypothetical protein [Vibrio sp. SCSIO 43140]USD58845.1 hypothetical protein J4N45_09920 [Vibrio sp. SCSIO 43140]